MRRSKYLPITVLGKRSLTRSSQVRTTPLFRQDALEQNLSSSRSSAILLAQSKVQSGLIPTSVMSVAAMVKQPPPTPPSADGRQLLDGFGHLVQHHVRSEHQANPYALDNSPYMPSGTTSFDNTPEPEIGQWYMDQYGNKSFRLYQEQNNLGVDMSFVGCAKRLAGRKTNEAKG